MPSRDELDIERAALRRAERDIADGERRLRTQVTLTLDLAGAGRDTRQAERLTDLLHATLTQWCVHRELIRARIVYLENRQDAP